MSGDDEFSVDDQMRLQSVTAPDEQTRFNVDCGRIFMEGSRDIPDFESSIDALKRAGVTTTDFLLQALETNHPAKILHHLGQDVDAAKRIVALPPVRRAAALAALERGEVYQDSGPAWKRPKSMKTEEDLSDAEWSVWRKEQLAKRNR
jgi:hypothetical protein